MRPGESTGVDPFLAKFDVTERKRKSELPLSHFKTLLHDVVPVADDHNSLAALYLRGIDIDDSKSISRSWFASFVPAPHSS
jgi:hypothetical protein